MELARRPATESDIDFARQAHHQAYRVVVERQFGPWVEKDQDNFFALDWAANRHEIVFCDGAPCGYVSILDGPEDIWVVALVLMPAFQNRGIGTAILREAMERARPRAVPVRLGTFHLNRAANLYRRLGFQETGRTETHILFEWRAT